MNQLIPQDFFNHRMYAFDRCSYPKRLALHSRYTFDRLMHS